VRARTLIIEPVKLARGDTPTIADPTPATK
jgi:hypothetical protein